jgi:hypothetical protein
MMQPALLVQEVLVAEAPMVDSAAVQEVQVVEVSEAVASAEAHVVAVITVADFMVDIIPHPHQDITDLFSVEVTTVVAVIIITITAVVEFFPHS